MSELDYTGPVHDLGKQLEWLRLQPTNDIMIAADAVSLRYVRCVVTTFQFPDIDWYRIGGVTGEWKPVVDSIVIPDYPTSIILSGGLVDVPTLMGYVFPPEINTSLT